MIISVKEVPLVSLIVSIILFRFMIWAEILLDPLEDNLVTVKILSLLPIVQKIIRTRAICSSETYLGNMISFLD
ncbi:hypothetical protein D3C81_1023310 [compost metagenome]